MAKGAVRSAAVERFERQIVENGKKLVDQWGHYIDAENAPPVEDAYDRFALATVLETTNRVLQQEALQTTSVFGSNYVKTMLGMTRQIFPRMFGTNLVSVQPLDRPSGQIFHLKTTRDDDTTLGIRPQDDASGIDATAYQTASTYSDHAAGEGGAIAKGMKLSITSSNVAVTKVKKLKTEASWELQTDLAAVHNLNAMDLLQGAAVDEIAQELDAHIVTAVRNAAIANGTVTFGVATAGYAVDKWPARIQRAILEAHKIIRLKSLRDPNVMVVGMDAYIALQDLNGFRVSPNLNWETATYGVLPVGSLNGQYEVYLSGHIPANEILLGRRGSGFLDAGIVYSPYVALFVSDRFFDPAVQKTIQSFASRYEIFTISNTLYARILIDESGTTVGIDLP